MTQKTKSSHNVDYRNKKKSEFIMIYTLMFLIFILVFAMLLNSVSRFYSGYHNVDLGANIKWLNSEFNLNLVDLGSDFQERTGQQLYILGLEAMRTQFLLGIIYSFAMGFMLSWLILVSNPKRK